MAEIIDTSDSRGGGLQEIEVTFENVNVTNETDSSVKSLTIQGYGDIPRGSSKSIQSLKFSQITMEADDGEKYDLIARTDGFGGTFSSQNCTFSGPDFGSVMLKGEQSGELAFSPNF